MSEVLVSQADSPPAAPTAVDVVRAYHQRSKHRFEAYAAGPGSLDWDAQPAPFRHFVGASSIQLPLAEPARLATPPDAPVAPDLAALGALLHLSFGISAWKTLGPDRWSVRANPSSGNLHPVEAYVLVAGLPDLADGLYHYRPEVHALELRAAHPQPFAAGPAVAVGLSCIMWREAWKYGERAFRYCQLDTGHALGCLHYAAALLGWRLAEQPQVGTHSLEALLGLDRASEFPGKRAEVTREEAELLVLADLGAGAAPLNVRQLQEVSAAAQWQGVASQIDRFPMFRWPVMADVAAATRRADDSGTAPLPQGIPRARSAATLLGRRSAQRFDGSHLMPQADFRALLESLRPAAGARVSLLMFVHRVDGLAPGLYLLARDAERDELLRHVETRFKALAVEGFAPSEGFYRLIASDPTELKRVARSLHCHQDIASNACLALGMLTRFGPVVDEDPAAYRDLYREAGLLGQVLYIEAEALGLRGTGIGCFFDDPVHALAGLDDGAYQTLYHFTLGLPVDDGRIETGPAYPHLTESQS